MYAQDLLPSCGIGQVNFDVDFKPAWPEDGLIKQVLSVGHSDDDDIVERLHSVDVGQQLVDYLIAHLCAHPAIGSSLLADGVDLVEDYYVERTLITQLLLIRTGLCE